MQIQEYKDQAQMQKDLYDSMVNALRDDNTYNKSVQGQVQLAQKIYENNINELKDKHQEAIEQLTNK